jgi:hypothetical protein
MNIEFLNLLSPEEDYRRRGKKMNQLGSNTYVYGNATMKHPDS